MNRWLSLPLLLPILCITSRPLTAQHSHHTCGTALYMELESRSDRLTEKEAALLREMKFGKRSALDRSLVSRNGHFRIHYDLTGPNAPAQKDANSNNVPDYIDSVDYYLEYAWQKEIDECGYIAPPLGSGGFDGSIDVYITDCESRSIYGAAWPDGVIGPNRRSGYLELDNDYTILQTKGIDALRVTAAHELHHIIEFASYRFDLTQSALYESTATWMEYKVHPDVDDYRNYFDAFLAAPHEYAFSTHNTGDNITGYAHMHYLQSVVQQTDPDVVRAIWDEFSVSGKSFDAINKALLRTESGRNLANSYCTFAHWSYYTGKNAARESFFAKAEFYPTIIAAQHRQMPEIGETGFVGSLSPLSFGVWRLSLHSDDGSIPDTVDFLVTNARSDIGAGGYEWLHSPEVFTLDVSTTPLENYLTLEYGTDKLFYRLNAPHGDFCVEAIVNGSPASVVAAHPAPQPFHNDGADRMIFAVDLGKETVVQNIRIEIYSASMTYVTGMDRLGLESLENLRGVVWDGRDERGELVPSGIYTYTLAVNGGEPSVGKFAVMTR